MTKRGKKFWFGMIGALIGVSATIWYWSHASRHVLAPEWVPPDKAFSQSDRLDIMEAVYRRMGQQSSSNAPPQVWFLGVGALDDPPAELLQRLGNLPSPVKPLSAGSRTGGLMLDRETGKPGATLHIQGAKMAGAGAAWVHASYQPATNATSLQVVYTVRREGGAWNVTGEAPK
jgi:hypothetical protein